MNFTERTPLDLRGGALGEARIPISRVIQRANRTFNADEQTPLRLGELAQYFNCSRWAIYRDIDRGYLMDNRAAFASGVLSYIEIWMKNQTEIDDDRMSKYMRVSPPASSPPASNAAPSSPSAAIPAGAELPKENAGQLVEIIGTQGVLDNFADGTSLKIKLADVPESKRAAVITELIAVFQKHGVMDCVEKKAIIVPKPEFRAGRWTRFDAETNRRINTVIPLIASFRAHNG